MPLGPIEMVWRPAGWPAPVSIQYSCSCSHTHFLTHPSMSSTGQAVQSFHCHIRISLSFKVDRKTFKSSVWGVCPSRVIHRLFLRHHWILKSCTRNAIRARDGCTAQLEADEGYSRHVCNESKELTHAFWASLPLTPACRGLRSRVSLRPSPPEPDGGSSTGLCSSLRIVRKHQPTTANEGGPLVG